MRGMANSSGLISTDRISVDAMLLDELHVKLQAAAGSLAHYEVAVLQRRAIVEQAPSPGHVLDDVAIGDRGDDLGRDLGQEVAGQRQSVCLGEMGRLEIG